MIIALNLNFAQKLLRKEKTFLKLLEPPNVAPAKAKRSSKVAKHNRDRPICVLVLTENIYKTELFDDDEVTITMTFPCPSFDWSPSQPFSGMSRNAPQRVA